MSIFSDEQSHPITLLRNVVSRYGIECFGWEFETLRQTLVRETSFSISKLNIHKIMAAAAVANRDTFWTDWQHFQFIAQALNNVIPVSSMIHDFSVAQLMVAVDIANQIRRELGSVTSVPEFSEEVAKYIAAQALEDGVWFLPEPLEFAQAFAAKRMTVCHKCGNHQFYLEPEDRICAVCSEKWDTESLKDFKPKADLVKRGIGNNTSIVEKNPTKPVADLLDQYLIGKIRAFDHTPEGLCAARIVVALEYVSKRRQQLREQA